MPETENKKSTSVTKDYKKIKYYGRTTIYANYTEEQLLEPYNNKDYNTLDTIIIDILENSKFIHNQNKNETDYLYSYYYGKQDVLKKVKYTRPEINNQVVENWAYALIDFKTAFLLGKPIQYVQLNNSGEEEISTLNKFVRYENKKAKDLEIYTDILVAGRGFRYTNKDPEKALDEAPFELINCPISDTEVVYSSKLGNKQLLSYIVTDMQTIVSETKENGEIVSNKQTYQEYTVYLRNGILTYNNKDGQLKRVEGEEKPLLYNEHIITEYRINEKRISLIELAKDILDSINDIESLDQDDFAQYVNAIMVFTNATVSSEDLTDIKSMGAVCINSTDQRKASVDLLQGNLNAQNTQVLYNRLVNSLHQILGIPMASDNGNVTYGDTGQARLTGQGFTSASIRAEKDETMFAKCDYESLKVILKVCKEVNDSGITNLKASDIDSKFQRDMSDNLLVKAEALQSLYACDIPRKYANAIVNLFSDPHAVTEEQQSMFGDQVSQQGAEKEGEENGNNSDDNVNPNGDIFGNTKQLVQEKNNDLKNIQNKTQQAM